jgi:hypothetical protein
MTRHTWFKEGTYYARNRVKRLQASKKRYHELASTESVTPWHTLLASAKVRAAKKGLAFDLTTEWAEARWTGCCELTGIEFRSSRGRQGIGMYAASLDRIDSSRGYTQDNCRFVLGAVNMMKSIGTDADVISIAQAIVRNAAPQCVR